ncbi:bifunctional folylpolyglutamate synthase/dihydrofolate synthase [Mameliella alba]|uniref:Dihydrofolate synthase/folylpolyglutamate synthase n=1 Tax=Mameliella alba TaxID=561184 RepID=A0A0B3SJ33_9RHOB|nr:folylpolyglutamate synthase/dihydrofolate synthase family protein [Mameliella alba]KHQ50564.1 FolC bifunctional protein [Mameliella alba]PTR35753.1 dihydrofolate synthase/folylpolyglutamate synthase [Mameliella alba]SDE13012.1 dihydrofolate synthase / folylpolyglutamate synthase [Mameliella alba]BBU53943.1 bifunctional folylpolyglutamate synthase/dihydrofolate synthase [Mameliella alba]GGF66209.1 bifunctional folylpolyglutamate synthase/dihydrofolate synthase [Mameliella alba]
MTVAAPGSDQLLQRMMTLHPKIIDLTLDRVWQLLEALGHPEEKLPPVIHLAGTNGKGSTQAMIRAGIEAAGQTCHAYTSPHLARFHERIRLRGELISEQALTEVLDECVSANGGASITYFEITTCAAILAMSRVPADYVLLETGLGGRLDATNVVARPAATVITPISMDHEQYLGDTLARIAGEKAGIIKRGVPCVVGPQPDEALEVIEARAEALGAPLLAQGQHWHAWEERGRLVFQDENGLLDLPMPALPGAHQIENAGAALAVLRHLGLGEAAFEGAMTQATWPARMQRLRQGPLAEMAPEAELWLDGGHNPAAGKALAAHLGGLPERPTHLICGMLNTKDARGFLTPLAAVADSLTAVNIPGEANTLSAEDTARMAADSGHRALMAEDVGAALRAIVAETPEARVLICGSLYLAGSVLRDGMS